MKKTALIAAAALVATFATITHAASPADESTAGFGSLRSGIRTLVTDIAQELANLRAEAPLTDAQRKEVRSVVQSHKAEIRAQFEKGRDARRAMIDAVAQNGPDSPEAQKAADAIGEVARNRALLTAKVVSEITPLLTPQQKTLAKDALERIEGKVDDMFSGLSK
jgi:Spy/CpxP family protein refolding chaperone